MLISFFRIIIVVFVLSSCTDRARWQIHALESPKQRSFSARIQERDQAFTAAAS